MDKLPVNRMPLDSPIFGMRGEDVKWPTIRKAWLNNDAVEELRQFVTKVGKSIIFLDGKYKTNLNRWAGKGPIERAVFFEYLMKHPKMKGGIFMLAWIGDFHNGCIYHCAWQYPQVRCWHEIGENAEEMFEKAAFRVYKHVVQILYKHSNNAMDQEVKEFINVQDQS